VTSEASKSTGGGPLKSSVVKNSRALSMVAPLGQPGDHHMVQLATAVGEDDLVGAGLEPAGLEPVVGRADLLGRDLGGGGRQLRPRRVAGDLQRPLAAPLVQRLGPFLLRAGVGRTRRTRPPSGRRPRCGSGRATSRRRHRRRAARSGSAPPPRSRWTGRTRRPAGAGQSPACRRRRRHHHTPPAAGPAPPTASRPWSGCACHPLRGHAAEWIRQLAVPLLPARTASTLGPTPGCSRPHRSGIVTAIPGRGMRR
jgi:hypothetical protein